MYAGKDNIQEWMASMLQTWSREKPSAKVEKLTGFLIAGRY